MTEDGRFEAELRRLDERITAQRDLIDTLVRERAVALEEFRVSVTRRFDQVNEFRQALDDLSKQMATRRELETAVISIRVETATALSAANTADAQQNSQLSELRSRLDSGPGQRGKEIVAYALSMGVLIVAVIGVLVALLSH